MQRLAYAVLHTQMFVTSLQVRASVRCREEEYQEDPLSVLLFVHLCQETDKMAY